MTVLNVYVPVSGTVLERMIVRGSGIVGTPHPPGTDRVLIDYEGNLYGSENLKTYEDRLLHAGGRHAVRYPTVARMAARSEDLLLVGSYDTETRELHVSDQPALDAWTAQP